MSENERSDWVPEDDAVIGRATKWSLVVLLAVGLAAGGIYFTLTGEDDVPEEVRDKAPSETPERVVDRASLPEVRFVDITREAGIDFVHESGAAGDKLLPETMGGGAAFFDLEGDADPDLFFVNGAAWDASDGEPGAGNRLYRNEGGGRFTDVTADSGLTHGDYGMGVAVGDYDGDGWSDLFTTGVGANHLFRNRAGASPLFEDRAEPAGVAGDPEGWTTSAGFFDADLDGDLDLFVCEYVRWSREIDEQLAFTLNGTDRAYGPPTQYAGTFSHLYRNEGDGSFQETSEEAGIRVTNPATGEAAGKALGVSFVDVDADRYPDILVANDTVQNHLFRNRGDGTFEELGFSCGFGFDRNGQATGAMGIDAADFRADGGLAIGVGNFANEMSSLYVRRGREISFTDDAMGEGIGSPSRLVLSFGLFFFDYDLDGWLDLLQVNGHLEESINEVQPSQTYLQSPQLFWNAGPDQRSAFLEVPGGTTGDLGRKLAGRGSAYADIDGDGDLDVLIVQVGAAPVLLRNDQSLGHRWLRVRLEDSGPNRHAIGATVELRTDRRTLRRRVAPTRSYLSQSERAVTFGLASGETLEGLTVTWPDGERTDEELPELDREVELRRTR